MNNGDFCPPMVWTPTLVHDVERPVLSRLCARYVPPIVGTVAHDVEQGPKRYWQRGKVASGYKQALKALGMRIPSIIWADWNESDSKGKTRKKSAS